MIFFLLISCANMNLSNRPKVYLNHFSKIVEQVNKECLCETDVKSCSCTKLYNWAKDSLSLSSKDKLGRNKIMMILESDLSVHPFVFKKTLNLILEELKNKVKLIGWTALKEFDSFDSKGYKTAYYYIAFNLISELFEFLEISQINGKNFVKHDFGLSSFVANQIAPKGFLVTKLYLPSILEKASSFDSYFLSSPVDENLNYVEHIAAMKSCTDIILAIFDMRKGKEDYKYCNLTQKRTILLKSNKFGWDPLSISIKYFFNDTVSSILKFLSELKLFEDEDEAKENRKYLEEIAIYSVNIGNFDVVDLLCMHYDFLNEELKIEKSSFFSHIVEIIKSKKELILNLGNAGLDVVASSVPFGALVLKTANIVSNEISGGESGVLGLCAKAFKQDVNPIVSNIFGFSEEEIKGLKIQFRAYTKNNPLKYFDKETFEQDYKNLSTQLTNLSETKIPSKKKKNKILDVSLFERKDQKNIVKNCFIIYDLSFPDTSVEPKSIDDLKSDFKNLDNQLKDCYTILDKIEKYIRQKEQNNHKNAITAMNEGKDIMKAIKQILSSILANLIVEVTEI